MENYPKISVVTVCYNADKTIERTLKSVISQKYSNLEYLVIDGRSTDGTLGLIDKYKEHIDYFVSEKDEGIYDAMNKGLAKAKGDWIVFLNADDFFTENALTNVAHAIKRNPHVDAVIGGAYIIEKIFEQYKIRVVFPIINENTVFYGQPFCHQALFLRKKVYEHLGDFNISYQIVADYEYTLRLFKNKFTYYIIKEPLAVFLATGISSTNHFRTTFESVRCMREYGINRFAATKNFIMRYVKPYTYKFLRYMRLHYLIDLWYEQSNTLGLRKNSPAYSYLSNEETRKLLKKYCMH